MEPRYNNLGAIAELTGPTWAVPHFKQYEADLPRPAAKPYYDLDIPGVPSWLSCGLERSVAQHSQISVQPTTQAQEHGKQHLLPPTSAHVCFKLLAALQGRAGGGSGSADLPQACVYRQR